MQMCMPICTCEGQRLNLGLGPCLALHMRWGMLVIFLLYISGKLMHELLGILLCPPPISPWSSEITNVHSVTSSFHMVCG